MNAKQLLEIFKQHKQEKSCSIHVTYPTGDKLLMSSSPQSVLDKVLWVWRGHQKAINQEMFDSEKNTLIEQVWEGLTRFDDHKGISIKNQSIQSPLVVRQRR